MPATNKLEAATHGFHFKAPEGENQPSTEVDLFISTEKIMVLSTDLKGIMMDHGLRTISYIADIGELVVIMARRRVLPQVENVKKIPNSCKKVLFVYFLSSREHNIPMPGGRGGHSDRDNPEDDLPRL